MKWMKDRDALIAQTMAFVQSVGRDAEAPEIASRRPSPVPANLVRPLVNGPAMPGAPRELPRMPREVPLSRPLAEVDMQTEIRQRIAAFRAHQERFNRERAEYFSATLKRLRTEGEVQGLSAPTGEARPGDKSTGDK